MRTIILLFTTLLLCSCSQKIKQKIGLTSTGPNEYMVKSGKPLEMPPHYELPEVKAEPQDVSSNKKK